MRTDANALTTFARLGIRYFWFRQAMVLGATAIATLYLASLVPIIFYLICLGAELREVSLDRRILAQNDMTQRFIDRMVVWQTVVAAWSSTAASVYGTFVAYKGEDTFLAVPLTYVFAAALYAATFNHQIKPVIVVRMVCYVFGCLALGSLGLFKAPPDQRFVAFAIFFTAASASFFFVLNAIAFRQSYVERREQEQDLIDRESLLRREMEERQNAQIAQESSETRFKSLFEGAPIPIREEDLSGMKRLVDALNLPDPDAFAAYIDAHPEFLDACAKEIKVVDANRASLAQHGYTDKSEMLAKVVKTLSPCAKKIVRKTVTTLNEGKPGASYETQIARADGMVRTVAATWSVLPGHEDTYARILLCSVDLTDRLDAEKALRQAQKMEAVGQLTGGVAHDFNNLLTIINGNLDLIEATSAVDRDLADPIHKAVQRGAELTQRLLAFSRKQPLKAKAIDLRELVTGMTAILLRSLGENYRISIETADDLWPVYADAGQVETALLNLSLNARDAMPNGGAVTYESRNITVPQDNDLELEPGQYVVLSVVDTGMGMPPDVMKRAFEPFFTTKEVGKGSGLGLSMVYGFVKQSGGALQISSDPGRETRVSLYLPRARENRTERASRPSAKPLARGKGETLLVLEDDAAVRLFLIRLLEGAGYKTLQASDAHIARDVFASGQTIDLIVSDVMLPGGIQGPDFVAEVLADRPHTPVVFISGRPDEFDKTKAAGLEGLDVLQKPFSKEAILDAIQQALTTRSAPR